MHNKYSDDLAAVALAKAIEAQKAAGSAAAAAADAERAEAAAQEAMSGTPTGYSNIVGSIAETFSSSTAYAAGDYVLKDSVLYRFTAAHAAGAWTGSDATAVNLGDETSNLKSALKKVKDATVVEVPVTDVDDITFVLHDGYRADTGLVYETGTYLNYGYTDKIPVQEGDIIRGYDGNTQSYKFLILCEYNGDTLVAGYDNTKTIPYTVPSGVDAFAVSVAPANKSNFRMTLQRTTIEYEPTLLERVESLESDMAEKASASDVAAIGDAVDAKANSSLFQKCELVEIPDSANKWNKSTVTTGMVHTNGQVYTGGDYDSFVYNTKMTVQEGDVLYFYSVSGSTVISEKASRIAAYNASDTVVSASGKENVYSYTVPSGISSVIITVLGTVNNTFMLIYNDSTMPTGYIPYQEAHSYYVATDDFIPNDVLSNRFNRKVDKDGDKQITIKNCQFFDMSKNLFDKTQITTGLLNKGTGAVLTSYTNYRTSDWISVDSSTDYVLSMNQAGYVYWCWYTENKTYISGTEHAVDTSYAVMSPSTAKYFRFSITQTVVEYNVQFEKGDTPTDYMAYGSEYIDPQYIPTITEEFLLNLPEKVYALVGVEMNIYFDNLVEGHDTDYTWNVNCSVGMQLERGYRITASTSGTYSLSITAVRKNDGSNVTKTASLIVTGTSAGSGTTASVIVLGDSTTANGIAMSKLHTDFADDVMSVETLGTCGTSPNNHEGRSGWRLQYYIDDASRDSVVNPFYNPSTETFDAAYYFTNSGVSEPDYFIVNLGINDMFGADNDIQMDSAIAANIGYCDTIINSILDATSETKVCICLTIPPNYSQDAYGKEYKCGRTQHRYKRNNLYWVKKLIEEYEGRESEGIYVIPINLNLDTIYNMGLETMPVNARNTAITYQSPIGNGGVHPVESGYWQTADMYTAFLKANAE